MAVQSSNGVAIDWWWKRSGREVYQVHLGLRADAGTGGSVLGGGGPRVPLLKVLCIQKANKTGCEAFYKNIFNLFILLTFIQDFHPSFLSPSSFLIK